MNKPNPPQVWDVKQKLIARNSFAGCLPRTPRTAYKPKPAMLKHEITAGIDYDMNGEPIASNQLLLDIRRKIAAEFGGYTEFVARGGYTHDNGKLVQEEARQWVIITDKPVKSLIRFIRKTLFQESVLHVSYHVKASFVYV